MTEIDLVINGKNIKEFEMDCVPRIGELLDINFEEYKGVCTVTSIKHVVFTEKKYERVRNYVKVEAVV